MAHPAQFESQGAIRTMAGVLSATLHFGLLLLIALSGGRRDGYHDDDTPVTTVVWLQSDVADRREGVEPRLKEPAAPAPFPSQLADLPIIEPPTLAVADPTPDAPREETDPGPGPDFESAHDTASNETTDRPSTLEMPEAQASALLQRIERLAEDLSRESHTRVEWRQDGMQYDAELVLEPARDGVEPDRVVAEISAEDRGRQLRTRIMLKRLPFSHYAQVIDRWDPMVQLHDDEIVGRVHINSRFNVLYDSQARPRLLGKVSTAAGGFNLEWQGRRRSTEVFQGGIETRAGRIPLSAQLQLGESARRDANARVHELAGDTRIRFFADGRYGWQSLRSDTSQYGAPADGQSVYFVAKRGATVYVQGVVSGRFLVYSPRRIVVEGDITYARDPREAPESDDYLGLVSDRDIEVAPPHVTGPGDLHIHAALFAKRRVVVTDIDHPRPATLWIYGSLAAGSLTASEPRYATKVEYDWRFERLRPPRFPSTDRFAAEEWDGQWTEVTERAESAAY